MPKMHQNMFGGRVPPGPAGEANAFLKPIATMKGTTSKGGVKEQEEKKGVGMVSGDGKG